MTKAICDLHIHSNCSDGSYSPAELVEIAEREGICAIALCDHNSVAGLAAFEQAANGCSVDAVPGIEITADVGGREVHILGLFVGQAARGVLSDYLEDLNRCKRQCNLDMVERLHKAGYEITYENVMKIAGEATPNRVHVSRELIRLGYVKTVDEAFATLLRSGGEFYKPAKRPDAFEVVSLLHELRVLPVLAHPLLNLTWEELQDFLPHAREVGLVGMEALYSQFDERDSSRLIRLAEHYRLLISGGSDFHGENRPEIAMGRGKGGLFVPMTVYEDLRTLAERN